MFKLMDPAYVPCFGISSIMFGTDPIDPYTEARSPYAELLLRPLPCPFFAQGLGSSIREHNPQG